MHRKTDVHIPAQSVLRRYDFCGVTSAALQSGEVEGVDELEAGGLGGSKGIDDAVDLVVAEGDVED